MKPDWQSENCQGIAIGENTLKAPMSVPPANSCDRKFYPEKNSAIMFSY